MIGRTGDVLDEEAGLGGDNLGVRDGGGGGYVTCFFDFERLKARKRGFADQRRLIWIP